MVVVEPPTTDQPEELQGEPLEGKRLVEAFSGIGLRPYRPCHLQAVPDGQGGLTVSWIRRTRIDGDSWDSYEVPLGEDRQLFQLRVRTVAGTVLREAFVQAQTWSYGAAEQAADGAALPFAIEVAQVSDRYGPGLPERIEIGL